MLDSTYEGDQPVSKGKHRRGVNDPIPDVQGTPGDGAANRSPGGKHADRPEATNPKVREDHTHEQPPPQEG
jgi:hypothetical protein